MLWAQMGLTVLIQRTAPINEAHWAPGAGQSTGLRPCPQSLNTKEESEGHSYKRACPGFSGRERSIYPAFFMR